MNNYDNYAIENFLNLGEINDVSIMNINNNIKISLISQTLI